MMIVIRPIKQGPLQALLEVSKREINRVMYESICT